MNLVDLKELFDNCDTGYQYIIITNYLNKKLSFEDNEIIKYYDNLKQETLKRLCRYE